MKKLSVSILIVLSLLLISCGNKINTAKTENGESSSDPGQNTGNGNHNNSDKNEQDTAATNVNDEKDEQNDTDNTGSVDTGHSDEDFDDDKISDDDYDPGVVLTGPIGEIRVTSFGSDFIFKEVNLSDNFYSSEVFEQGVNYTPAVAGKLLGKLFPSSEPFTFAMNDGNQFSVYQSHSIKGENKGFAILIYFPPGAVDERSYSVDPTDQNGVAISIIKYDELSGEGCYMALAHGGRINVTHAEETVYHDGGTVDFVSSDTIMLFHPSHTPFGDISDQIGMESCPFMENEEGGKSLWPSGGDSYQFESVGEDEFLSLVEMENSEKIVSENSGRTFYKSDDAAAVIEIGKMVYEKTRQPVSGDLNFLKKVYQAKAKKVADKFTDLILKEKLVKYGSKYVVFRFVPELYNREASGSIEVIYDGKGLYGIVVKSLVKSVGFLKPTRLIPWGSVKLEILKWLENNDSAGFFMKNEIVLNSDNIVYKPDENGELNLFYRLIYIPTYEALYFRMAEKEPEWVESVKRYIGEPLSTYDFLDIMGILDIEGVETYDNGSDAIIYENEIAEAKEYYKPGSENRETHSYLLKRAEVKISDKFADGETSWLVADYKMRGDELMSGFTNLPFVLSNEGESSASCDSDCSAITLIYKPVLDDIDLFSKVEMSFDAEGLFKVLVFNSIYDAKFLDDVDARSYHEVRDDFLIWLEQDEIPSFVRDDEDVKTLNREHIKYRRDENNIIGAYYNPPETIFEPVEGCWIPVFVD